MGLEALELVEGREVRVLVIEGDHEADRDQVFIEVIEEGAAISAAIQRPAETVLDQAGPVLAGLDLPDLLETDTVGLRVRARAQVETLDHLLCQRTAHAFGEQRVLCMQLDARLVAGLLAAVLGDAHVARGDALDPAVLVIEHLGGGEAGVDFDADLLRLLAQPAA